MTFFIFAFVCICTEVFLVNIVFFLFSFFLFQWVSVSTIFVQENIYSTYVDLCDNVPQ